MSKRLHYIDVAKGVLILLVIATHIDGISAECGISSRDLWRIGGGQRYLWTGFFMQAFFLLNGFTSNFNKPFKLFFIKDVKSLLLPMIFFSVLTKILDGICFGNWSIKTEIGEERWFWIEEDYWFLEALFLARLIYWATNRYIKINWQKCIIMLGLLVIGTLLNNVMDGQTMYPSHYENHFHYRNAMCMVLFVWLGDWLKNENQKYEKYYIVAVILYIFGLFVGWVSNHRNIIMVYNHMSYMTLATIPLYLYFATFGSLGIIWLSKIIGNNKILEYFGRGSLVVYTMQFFFLKLIISHLKIYFSLDSILETAIYFIVVFTITTLLCAFMVYIMELPYLRKMVGK